MFIMRQSLILIKYSYERQDFFYWLLKIKMNNQFLRNQPFKLKSCINSFEVIFSKQ